MPNNLKQSTISNSDNSVGNSKRLTLGLQRNRIILVLFVLDFDLLLSAHDLMLSTVQDPQGGGRRRRSPDGLQNLLLDTILRLQTTPKSTEVELP